MTWWNSAALCTCMHPTASKHPLYLSGIQCSQAQRDNITYNTQILKIPEVPEIWRTLESGNELSGKGLQPSQLQTNSRFFFQLTSSPKHRKKWLPSPEKKGSYKEIPDENVDLLLKQAQCGDQPSLPSTITPDINSRTTFSVVSLMQ